jgi:Fe-S cluster assembly protein SufD
MMTVSVSDIPLVAAAENLSPALPGHAAPWLGALRAKGLDVLRENGMPTRRSEAFKYSFAALGAAGKHEFVPALIAGDATVETLPAAITAIAGHRVVLVNGSWSAALSDRAPLPQGVSVVSLAQELETNPASLQDRLGATLDLSLSPYAALATGLLDDGVVVRIAAGTVLEQPIHIVSLVVTPGDGPVMVQPRLLIEVGADAVVTVIESHSALPGVETLTLPVAEVTLGRGAKLTHVKIRDDHSPAFHVASRQVTVEQGASYDAFALSMGGLTARDEIHVDLVGPHAQARVNGAYACCGYQHMDTTICITHTATDCRSEQTYKGVMDDHGRGVFQGRTIVTRGAQKTDGHQLHKALLLAPTAEVNVKPELTIYADDVSCSHGAACGELDEEALFYLQARGLDEDTARSLLIEGFLDEVVDTIEAEPLRDLLSGMVHQWLVSHRASKGTRK